MSYRLLSITFLFFTSISLFAQKPNFLLLIADDMTWSDCEPYGSQQVKTPNMSRLAAEGVCLDGMFTSTAMCAPTRQQLYTGLFPVRNGAYPNHSKVREGVRSLPHYLSALGYRVGLIGKTHFGPAKSFPFENLGKNSANYEKIKEFIERDLEEPYCLIVCSKSPHKVWDKGEASLYPPESIRVPPNLIDTLETKQSLSKYYAEITDLDGELGRCMDLVDESVSGDRTMLIFTSEQGMTLPFGGKWTCYDSGLKTAFIIRWPGRIKAQSRSSALIQYVDVVPTLIDAAGGDLTQIDTGSTDAEGQRGLDGRSFLGVLDGSEKTHRDYVYGVQTTKGIIHGSLYPIRSVRNKNYKFIRNLNHSGKFQNAYTKSVHAVGKYYKDYYVPLEKAALKNEAVATRLAHFQERPAEELYDLENDPFELNNLAGDERYGAMIEKFRQELASWMKQQKDMGVETELAGRK